MAFQQERKERNRGLSFTGTPLPVSTWSPFPEHTVPVPAQMLLLKPGMAGMLLCGYCSLLCPGQPFTWGEGKKMEENWGMKIFYLPFDNGNGWSRIVTSREGEAQGGETADGEPRELGM